MSAATGGSGVDVGDDMANVNMSLFIPAVVLLVLSFCFVVGRLYSHFSLTSTHSVEDVFIVVAWVLSLAVVLSLNNIFKYTNLILTADSDVPPLGSFFYWMWVFLWLYNVSNSMVKFSIVFQYRRLFVTSGFKKLVKYLIAILIPYALWTTGSALIPCWPINFYWTRVEDATQGKCLPTGPIFILYSALNVATNLIILIAPLPTLARMHLPMRQKLSLFLLFSVGGIFVLIISILKLLIFHSSPPSTPPSPSLSTSPPWTPTATSLNSTLMILLFSTLETSLSLICSCIPSFKPLLLSLFPSLISAVSQATDENIHGFTPSMSLEAGSVSVVSRRPTLEQLRNPSLTWKVTGKGSFSGLAGDFLLSSPLVEGEGEGDLGLMHLSGRRERWDSAGACGMRNGSWGTGGTGRSGSWGTGRSGSWGAGGKEEPGTGVGTVGMGFVRRESRGGMEGLGLGGMGTGMLGVGLGGLEGISEGSDSLGSPRGSRVISGVYGGSGQSNRRPSGVGSPRSGSPKSAEGAGSVKSPKSPKSTKEGDKE
ncbi:Hypothetical protein D9617_13g101130 [Elsinoe fawcettii]|nr:Hypothetical protein D9617_13g101130 [Elsinoe fawcettii]